MKAFALALGLASAVPLAAQAIEYNQVRPDESAIKFSYTQMGVTMVGGFRSFSSTLRFDPAAPAAAAAIIDVDLASVSTGIRDADAELVGKPWFHTQAFPTARFASSSVKALGDQQYEVAGTLTIKGTTRDIIVPATFDAQDGVGVFDGAFTIRRGDFSVGEGAWSKFDLLANDIRIDFRITATSGN